jgi:hypothetical protein
LDTFLKDILKNTIVFLYYCKENVFLDPRIVTPAQNDDMEKILAKNRARMDFWEKYLSLMMTEAQVN